MDERSLVDTNILVYAYDPADPAKQAAAQELIGRLLNADRLVISVQVLNEFCSAATRPNRPPSLSDIEAETHVWGLVAAAREVLPLTPTITMSAMDAVQTYGMALWDALLWATASEHGITIIYTEDMPGAPVVGGIRYVNPLLPPSAASASSGSW